jgi:hypothetical protein
MVRAVTDPLGPGRSALRVIPSRPSTCWARSRTLSATECWSIRISTGRTCCEPDAGPGSPSTQNRSSSPSRRSCAPTSWATVNPRSCTGSAPSSTRSGSTPAVHGAGASHRPSPGRYPVTACFPGTSKSLAGCLPHDLAEGRSRRAVRSAYSTASEPGIVSGDMLPSRTWTGRCSVPMAPCPP